MEAVIRFAAQHAMVIEAASAMLGTASYALALLCGVHRIEVPSIVFVIATTLALIGAAGAAVCWCLRPEEMRR